MRKKPIKRAERTEVFYNRKHWDLLQDLRFSAIQMMEALDGSHVPSIVHGSIARGDVTEKSDVDVFVPNISPSFMIETALSNAGLPVNRRIIIQATPKYVVKGHIDIDDQRSVSFPLTRMRSVEMDFYKFGGEVDQYTLEQGIRVPGVDKRLMLIEPTPQGHVESTIVGREETSASLLGVSPDIVLNRVRTLLRRDKVGRTGVFIKRELLSGETFEMVLKRLTERNPAVRRRLRRYKE